MKTKPNISDLLLLCSVLFLGACGGGSIVGGSIGVPIPVSNVNFPKTLSFCGKEWDIKSGFSGPGPNYFTRDPNNVFVDAQGQLHLKITKQIVSGREVWLTSEISSKESFGYGQYIFHLNSPIDKINENAVLGLFTWSDDPSYGNREIDIEQSRWGDRNNLNSQFVVAPYASPGHIYRFNMSAPNGTRFTQRFTWAPNSVAFRSSAGSFVFGQWTYVGNDVPVPGGEKVHMNLWLKQGVPPSDGRDVEVVVSCFEWLPLP